jgi:hypothetical protein
MASSSYRYIVITLCLYWVIKLTARDLSFAAVPRVPVFLPYNNMVLWLQNFYTTSICVTEHHASRVIHLILQHVFAERLNPTLQELQLWVTGCNMVTVIWLRCML